MIAATNQRPMWPPKIQIAGVSSLDEAMFCAQIGVDALGFTLEIPGGIHDGLTWDKAASYNSAASQNNLGSSYNLFEIL